MWKYTGSRRPSFAIKPEEDEESVWDYPRPPITDPDRRLVVVKSGNRVIAKTNRAIRVLETASPPTFYVPPEDVDQKLLNKAPGSSYCEWKGSATYWDIVVDGQKLKKAAWSYHNPSPRFESIDGFYSFYPGKVSCFVNGEKVKPQPGQFYGGWVTSEIVGPFKGEPGTGGW
ncbi:MAG: DUF427 domain-containing protein [Balneolaceae bacterium]|nr:DUF427 domain-containing protein [Balneolaceae bacterium]